MQLRRFDAFTRQVLREPSFKELGSVTGVYRKSGESWFDSAGVKVSDTTVQEVLDRVRSTQLHWRKPSNRCAYFPLGELDAVVAITCETPPRMKTRAKLQGLLQDTFKHANDEFDAAHDPLTGLYNSRSIDAVLRRIGNADVAETATDRPKVLRAVGLIAMDLDHFKQINDSHGHDYGDIVLQCFARRLNDLLQDLEKKNNDLRLTAGRSGGEEFVVIMEGVISPELGKTVAEEIRASIAERVIPSDEEWASFRLPSVPPTFALPHISERRVTVSVGLSSLITPSTSSEIAMFELRREADEALYRAKAGGRNAVRWFPEIRDRFGAVIEHHEETDIVVIDIGSQLNVRQGDEFFVYHPDFSGDKPFIFSDGRTKKRLGTYPRLSCGRVTVIDVQSEIAFCQIADRKIGRFPHGSMLEYIPIGSIAHLIAGDPQLGPKLGLPLSPVADLNKAIEATNTLKVLVFRLDDMESLERARGVVFINRALAILFEVIQEFVPKAKVGQLQTDTLAVVAEGLADAVATAGEIVAKAKSRCGEAATFGGGVHEKSADKALPGDKSSLKWTGALDLARYAALPSSRFKGALVQRFTPQAASRILDAHKHASALRAARADYKAFKDLGVSYWGVENQMGLIELANRNNDVALSYFVRGLELEPKNESLTSNKGFTEFIMGDSIAAYSTFSTQSSQGIAIDTPYLHAFALSAYKAFQEDADSIPRSDLVALLENAKENGMDMSIYGIDPTELQLALNSLAEPKPARPLSTERKGEKG